MSQVAANPATGAYRQARDQLVALGHDYQRAVEAFRWPDLGATFNWAVDWFDGVARERPDALALVVVEEDGRRASLTYAEMSHRSSQVARWLSQAGVSRGDRVMLMLGNQVELWESMLAIMKLGAVIMPTTTALGPADLAERLARTGARHVIVDASSRAKFDSLRADPGDATRAPLPPGSLAPAGIAPAELTRVVVRGDAVPEPGWLRYEDAYAIAAPNVGHPGTAPGDTLLLYFTSGTTSRPKLVEHTQVSYPVGHLTTMYWIGLRPGDVHLNISSPGWAKHAWSSFFAPWSAEATIFVYNYTRGSTRRRCSASCAPRPSRRSAPRRPYGGC
nr:AMP-binding protein [Pseudofrankia sp. DC12]